MSIGDRNSRILLHRRCHYEDHCVSGIWWRYRIAGDCRGKKLSQILRFCGNSWKFSPWILWHSICWRGKRVQSTKVFCENLFFFPQIHTFSSLKVSRYTVFILHELLVYICWCGNVCSGSWAKWGCLSFAVWLREELVLWMTVIINYNALFMNPVAVIDNLMKVIPMYVALIFKLFNLWLCYCFQFMLGTEHLLL